MARDVDRVSQRYGVIAVIVRVAPIGMELEVQLDRVAEVYAYQHLAKTFV